MGGALALENGRMFILDRSFRRRECNSSALQEFRRRSAAGKDPHKVIGKLADFPVNLDRQAPLTELGGHGVEENLELARCDVFLNAFCVSVLQPADFVLAAAGSNLVALLKGQEIGREHV